MMLLPHASDRPFLVWVGLETDVIFNRGIDLPGFASFPLLEQPDTRAMVADFARDQIAVARANGFGTILETTTWVANRDRARDLGYDEAALVSVNRDAVSLLADVRGRCPEGDILISANIGPRDDAYAPSTTMSAPEAQEYHGAQLRSLQGSAVDLASAYTMSNAGEAIGIVRAAQQVDIPCVISFTVETDGRLPNGQSVDDAIAETDGATAGAAAYFMINCAHPDHFAETLTGNPRLGGLVVNASRCSHAELDEAEHLDDGDPEELGAQIASLLSEHDNIRVFGGCCGTDQRHLQAMAQSIGKTL